ncbi:MAG: hypothetical protein ABJO91_09455 [Ekhidna sp.]
MSSVFLDLHSLVSGSEVEEISKRKVRDGEIKQYTKDKRLKTIVNYNKGIKHGVSYLYHDDGETVLLSMPYNNGKREGTSKKYYKSGVLYASTSYHDDLLHGKREIYYSSGQIKAIINYGFAKPGVGTVEYLTDGTLKQANSIEITEIGNNYFLSTSQECRNLKFYIGKLIEDQFFDAVHPDIKLLPKENGSYFVDLSVYTPSFLKYQDVVCHCESSQGNPIIMKKKLF